MLQWIYDLLDRRAIKRRITQHFDLFNCANWSGCAAMVDPYLDIDVKEFRQCMVNFYDQCRARCLTSIHVDKIHQGSKHDARPFAYAKVEWYDAYGRKFKFSERWIKHNGKWYTRSVGLIWAEPAIEE